MIINAVSYFKPEYKIVAAARKVPAVFVIMSSFVQSMRASWRYSSKDLRGWECLIPESEHTSTQSSQTAMNLVQPHPQYKGILPSRSPNGSRLAGPLLPISHHTYSLVVSNCVCPIPLMFGP